MMRGPIHYPCLAGPPGTDVWCPWCYENVRKRANHVGHRSYVGKPKPKYIDWSAMFKRPTLGGSAPSETFECPDEKFLKEFPTLAQGMCDPWGADRKPRELWTLSFKMDCKSVQVTVSDQGLKASAYTNAPSLQQALRLLDKAAGEETLTWRRWRQK